jgi:hypothetical protein
MPVLNTIAAKPGIRWFTCDSVDFPPRAIRRPMRIEVALTPHELHLLIGQLEALGLESAECGCATCTLAADAIFDRIAELREMAR